MTENRQNILIIKLGAFGNIILSLAAFTAIRHYHAGARISVLTSQTYAPWLKTFPYFDEVLVDPRPRWWEIGTARKLGRMLADGHFSQVYDLQTSPRSSRYFRLFPPQQRPEWSGIAYGCSLPDRDPKRNVLHDTVRQQGQLAPLAGPGIQRLHHGLFIQGPVFKAGVGPDHFVPALLIGLRQRAAHPLGKRRRPRKGAKRQHRAARLCRQGFSRGH